MGRQFPQAGTIPIKDGKICLITSSNGKRWVIPKGMIETGHSAAETAMRETWEEAGLIGSLTEVPLGVYTYEKYGGICVVTVFAMQVVMTQPIWPEATRRRREWCDIEVALSRIHEPELQTMISRLGPVIVEI